MTTGDNDQVWSAGLQLERTSLAWRRLALALLGLALVVPRLGWPVIGVWTLLVASHRRYLSTHRSLTSGTALPLPDGRLVALTVLSALTLAVVAVVIVAAQFI